MGTSDEQATQTRLEAFARAWPRPGAGYGVSAAAVLVVLRRLAPLADMVLKLPVGYAKGYYGAGTGYLTGSSKVTADDLAVPARLFYELETRLPAYGARPLEPWLYAQIKQAAYRLLLLATDLDMGAYFQKHGTAATAAWSKIASLAVVPTTPAAEVGSTANQGATDARKLTEDMLALKKVIEVRENYDRIMAADATFVPAFELMLKGWNDFLRGASGADVAWYNLPGKIWTTLSDRWFNDTTNFNVVQDYRTKFNAFYAKVQQLLGKQPTPAAPEQPKARKEDKSVGESADRLVTGALIIGGAFGGGFLLLKAFGR